MFGDLLAVHDLESLRLKRARAVQHDLVHGQTHVAAAMFVDEIPDFG